MHAIVHCITLVQDDVDINRNLNVATYALCVDNSEASNAPHQSTKNGKYYSKKINSTTSIIYIP